MNSTRDYDIQVQSNISSRDALIRGHHQIKIMPYLPHVKVSVIKGHLTSRDTPGY